MTSSHYWLCFLIVHHSDRKPGQGPSYCVEIIGCVTTRQADQQGVYVSFSYFLLQIASLWHRATNKMV